MSKATQLHGDDIPLAKLRQSRKRKIDKRYGQRIKASINNVGLIEPLVVCKDESGYVILDGNYRYELLLEMGFETAPCFIVENYDLYTMNRQVNHVSPLEEAKMIQKASEVVGEKQIAAALGLKSITRRLTDSTKSKLHADVLKAYDNGTLGQSAVKEMAHVVPVRQREILTQMRQCGDYSVRFVKTQILKTPKVQRREETKQTPWTQRDAQNQSLVKKFQDAENDEAFFSGLYRKYISDTTKCVIKAREFLVKPKITSYLEKTHPNLLRILVDIVKVELNDE